MPADSALQTSEPMHHIRQVVDREFTAVNDFIIEQLQSRVELVENIGHYIIDAGGKRLRPMLTLLSAGAIGASHADQVRLAAVIEFIHTATLLHDDVVDLSELRRGRPTANAEFGNAPSVLVGDFLYSRAFQVLVDIGNMPLMGLLSDTTNLVAEGEVLQLARAGNADTDEATYYDVIRSKTAVLFAAACSGAAILGEDSAYRDRLYDYGMNLGIAFQLVDDILDYEGDPKETGKNIGDDLAEGKPTLPLIHLLREGSDAEKAMVRHAIEHKSAADLQQIIEAVQNSGALQYCQDAAARYSQTAIDAAEALPASPHRDAMITLSRDALQRRS